MVMIEKKASGAMTNEAFECCIREWCMFTYKKKKLELTFFGIKIKLVSIKIAQLLWFSLPLDT